MTLRTTVVTDLRCSGGERKRVNRQHTGGKRAEDCERRGTEALAAEIQTESMALRRTILTSPLPPIVRRPARVVAAGTISRVRRPPRRQPPPTD